MYSLLKIITRSQHAVIKDNSVVLPKCTEDVNTEVLLDGHKMTGLKGAFENEYWLTKGKAVKSKHHDEQTLSVHC